MRSHDYALELVWDDPGRGTTDYKSYSRRYRVTAPGKPALLGTADPTFRGEPGLYNPEELLVAALSSCHMLSYLALCSLKRIVVLDYADRAHGRMVETPGGGGAFERVVLEPRVVIAPGSDLELARTLHDEAHKTCFIAASCNFAIEHRPTISVGEPRPASPARSDLAVRLANRPGALAEFGEVLGRAGISVEGGGGFVVGDAGELHFLVADGPRAVAALREAGIDVIGAREVVTVRLDQGRPGQLGALARAMADAGVNLVCVYSDHENQLIVVPDDLARAREVAATWPTRA